MSPFRGRRGHGGGRGHLSSKVVVVVVVVVGRLLRAELSPAVKWMVVRSIPFDRLCLVVYSSRLIWVQTMAMTTAGYML